MHLQAISIVIFKKWRIFIGIFKWFIFLIDQENIISHQALINVCTMRHILYDGSAQFMDELYSFCSVIILRTLFVSLTPK